MVDLFMQFYFMYLTPVMEVLYVPLDGALGWLGRLSGPAAVTMVGVFTGLGVNLFQKYCSDQKLLGNCKTDMDKLKKFSTEAKKAGDKDAAARLGRVLGRVSNKYMMGSLKPALWTVPPICVLAMWVGARLAFDPVRPGREVEIQANFEDEAGGFACLRPGNGLQARGPLISKVESAEPLRDKEVEKRCEELKNSSPAVWYKPWSWFGVRAVDRAAWYKPWTWWFRKETAEDREARIKTWADKSVPVRGMEARWTLIAPDKPGDYLVEVCYRGRVYPVKFPVRARGGPPPDYQTFFNWSTPGGDGLQLVQFNLRDSMPKAWWNLGWQWIGVYIIVAVVLGVGLRFALRVN